MTILLNNVNVDTVGEIFTFSGGSKVLFIRADNFGGGTLTIEAADPSDPSERFATLDGGAFTLNGTKIIESTVPGMKFRAVLAGSSGASNVFASML